MSVSEPEPFRYLKCRSFIGGEKVPSRGPDVALVPEEKVLFRALTTAHEEEFCPAGNPPPSLALSPAAGSVSSQEQSLVPPCLDLRPLPFPMGEGRQNCYAV